MGDNPFTTNIALVDGGLILRAYEEGQACIKRYCVFKK